MSRSTLVGSFAAPLAAFVFGACTANFAEPPEGPPVCTALNFLPSGIPPPIL